MSRRWIDAIHFKKEDFQDFWQSRFLAPRDVLLILGLGWDPRMTVVAHLLKLFGGIGRRDVRLIRFSPYLNFQSPHQKYIDKNYQLLSEIAEGWATINEVFIQTRNAENQYIGDELISFEHVDIDLSSYNDIIVDISSLPKSLYFPLLYIIVNKCLQNNDANNVHVAACQDSGLDSQIVESSDDTRLVKGFRGGLNMVSQQDIPRIWVPLLAGNNATCLEKLYRLEDLSPTDIYPILPFPSENPRTDDNLLSEYTHTFVNVWQLNSMNIIYAAEDDPLDVYRRLLSLHDQQQEALNPLGGVKIVVSPLSSKLSSIGAFLAAFEKGMAIAHAIGRHAPPTFLDDNSWDESHFGEFQKNLHSVWLTGEPYV